MTHAARLTLSALAFVVLIPPSALAQTVTVTVPAGVSFNVIDVTASTTGSPNPTTITFSNPTLFATTQQLKVSVEAATTTFSGPGTTRIPASNVSWTATASPGTTSNGSLSSTTYKQVYLSPKNLKTTTTGTVNLTWTLAAIAAAGLRSGTHTVTVRWKFEAF